MQRKAGGPELNSLFTTLSERIPQIVWTSEDNGDWTWSNARWTAYTGLSVEASQGTGWYNAIEPGDIAVTVAAWQKATESGVLDMQHRVVGADSSDEARWFATHAEPLPGVQGRKRLWLGTCTDIQEAKLSEQREAEVRDSARQRLSDVMSLTRLVVRRTVKAGASLDDVAVRLDSRLDAIARTQAMVGRHPGGSVDLAEFLTDELRAHTAHEGEQLHVEGPSFPLQGKAAGLLGLAIHELAMNAVEHGALSRQQGRIAVTWGIETSADRFSLRFEWLETGVRVADAPPRRRGFGTELIGDVLAQELGAASSLGFGRDGVCCTIVLPVASDGAWLGLRPRG